MDLNEYQADWFLRYGHICRKRQTDQQKARFIHSLLIDLQQIRSDIRIVEARNVDSNGVLSRNIYVGDVKNASVIYATYYDTPHYHLGPYFFMNRAKQSRQTLVLNFISSLGLILIGVVFTLKIAIPYMSRDEHLWYTWGIMATSYFGITWLIGKLATGIPSRYTLIRNTSSLLWLLNFISLNKSSHIAFAFLDNGVTNEHGLQSLLISTQRRAKIVHFDSVGANAPLYVETNGRLQVLDEAIHQYQHGLIRVMAGQAEGQTIRLSQSMLKDTNLNQNNLNLLTKLFTKEDEK
ncbi:hypothetical protein [Vaginisenegalia massiliensis]|uniref:hypothetical protein n=1 Tax=Vaginisenegalia massiliensis TaxID=2058294 RepID=UPI000F526E44|nr:hypothetical protein [Vaginisenegalia massiliensis]